MGTQYRSAIFHHTPEQKQSAERVRDELAAVYDRPIVTEIAPFRAFYRAEDYHQEFFRRNPSQPYCAAVVAPKVAKFRKEHLSRLKTR